MKKFWKSPWVRALIPVFLSFFLILIADWAKQLEIFSTLKTFVGTTETRILTLLNIRLG